MSTSLTVPKERTSRTLLVLATNEVVPESFDAAAFSQLNGLVQQASQAAEATAASKSWYLDRRYPIRRLVATYAMAQAAGWRPMLPINPSNDEIATLVEIHTARSTQMQACHSVAFLVLAVPHHHPRLTNALLQAVLAGHTVYLVTPPGLPSIDTLRQLPITSVLSASTTQQKLAIRGGPKADMTTLLFPLPDILLAWMRHPDLPRLSSGQIDFATLRTDPALNALLDGVWRTLGCAIAISEHTAHVGVTEAAVKAILSPVDIDPGALLKAGTEAGMLRELAKSGCRVWTWTKMLENCVPRAVVHRGSLGALEFSVDAAHSDPSSIRFHRSS